MVRSRRWAGCWALVFGCVAVSCGLRVSFAQTAPSPSQALFVGPWLLQPQFSFEVRHDDNLFRGPSNQRSERTLGATGALVATLPFRESFLQVNLAGGKQDYQTTTIARDTSFDLGVELQLNFSSGDRLVLRERFREDFARLNDLSQLGNELVFRGDPYRINRWEVELVREIPNRQGYAVRVRREDFNFEGDEASGFVDYRGFDTAFEYRQPLPRNRWWILHYAARRFNAYDPADDVGVPETKESSDALQAGLRGTWGPDQTYFVRFGLVRFRLDRLREGDRAEYSGVAGAANWRRRLGARFDLDVNFARSPLPSTFETYYISDDLQATLERRFLRQARATVFSRLGRNRYGEEVASFPLACRDLRVEDDRFELGANLSWAFHERLAVRLGATREQRGSNCDANEYEAMVVNVGFNMGWF